MIKADLLQVSAAAETMVSIKNKGRQTAAELERCKKSIAAQSYTEALVRKLDGIEDELLKEMDMLGRCADSLQRIVRLYEQSEQRVEDTLEDGRSNWNASMMQIRKFRLSDLKFPESWGPFINLK